MAKSGGKPAPWLDWKLALLVAGAVALAVFAYGYLKEKDLAYGYARVVLPDGQAIDCEVPLTGAGKELGLMGRESLCETCGMLFEFEREGRPAFWMKNMKMHIDIVFLDKEWRVVGIVESAEPCASEPCKIYSPEKNAMYVLELNANAGRKHGVVVGSRIRRAG